MGPDIPTLRGTDQGRKVLVLNRVLVLAPSTLHGLWYLVSLTIPELHCATTFYYRSYFYQQRSNWFFEHYKLRTLTSLLGKKTSSQQNE